MSADIRSYDSVAVLGAGMSAFRYPMTMQLPALLWQAIGEVKGANEELARRTGRSGTAKEILGADPRTVALGWQLARDLPAVRGVFQRAFADLDAGRDPSQAHRELARLIHEGRVQFVISYNWGLVPRTRLPGYIRHPAARQRARQATRRRPDTRPAVDLP